MTETANGSIFECRQLNKSFDTTPVLNSINLKVIRNRITTIIGPSGCGKTVLLKHFMMLMRPDSGEIYYNGQRIDQLSEKDLIQFRCQCGFLFQAGALFDSQTVNDNVAFPLQQHTNKSESEIEKIVLEKLDMVGLAHTAKRYPSELSGGQQKRIALARAIALSPNVILYDEPTTGLDPVRSDIINNLILKLQNELKITSIVVTHDMNSVYRVSDHIVMLDQGSIIAEGNVDEIKKSYNDKVQHFIYSSQSANNMEKEQSH